MANKNTLRKRRLLPAATVGNKGVVSVNRKRNMVMRVLLNQNANGQSQSLTVHEPYDVNRPFLPYTRHKKGEHAATKAVVVSETEHDETKPIIINQPLDHDEPSKYSFKKHDKVVVVVFTPDGKRHVIHKGIIIKVTSHGAYIYDPKPPYPFVDSMDFPEWFPFCSNSGIRIELAPKLKLVIDK